MTQYTLEDKFAAATAYMIEGTLRGAGRVANIPWETIRDWKKEQWFNDMIAQVIEQHADEYKASNHKIIKLAQEAVLDRLTNGDAILDKKGNIARKPVALRDAMIAYVMTIDKQRLLLNQPTSLSGKVGVDIKELAKNFKATTEAAKKDVPEAEAQIQAQVPVPIEDLLSGNL